MYILKPIVENINNLNYVYKCKMIKNNVLTFDNKSDTGIYWLTPNVAVFPGPTTVGIIAIPSKADPESTDLYLIDSGPDKNYSNIIYDALKKEFRNFTLKFILDTHSHADHAGGSAEFVRLTGCKIYSTQKEKSSIECPENQSAISYGANPLPEYKGSYYLAEPAFVDKVIRTDEILDLADNVRLEAVFLPGHYFEMIGVMCTVPAFENSTEKKKIFFTSDGIFTRGMLAKYWIPFLYDVRLFKESLDKIRSIKADYYVPSHGDIYTEISGLYELNMLSVVQNEQTILRCLKEKGHSTFEDILKYIADSNEMSMRLSQFMLVGSTIRSYITYLYEENKITWVFKENKMYWKIKNSSDNS